MDKRTMFEWNDRTLTKYKGRAKHVSGIPQWIDRIDSSAFWNNKIMTTLEIPDSVYFLDLNAFHGCTSLKEVKLSANLDQIAIGLFSDCSSLKNIEIPNGVKDISSFAFMGCKSLENIEFGNNVRRIGCLAFGDCASLSNLVMPKSVNYIERSAFKGCKKLRSIHLRSDCYLRQGEINLGIRNFATCTLFVPKGTENVFRSHPYFSKFKNIIPE